MKFYEILGSMKTSTLLIWGDINSFVWSTKGNFHPKIVIGGNFLCIHKFGEKVYMLFFYLTARSNQ